MKHVVDDGLERILSAENAGEIIKYLMGQYASQSVENARDLHMYSNSLVASILAQTEARNQELRFASTMLVMQRSLPENLAKTDPGMLFSTMVPVCKALYPKGVVEKGSEAHKRYFKQFLELFHDKKAFNWKMDGKWAETNGYTDYLKLVEEKEKETVKNGS